MRLLPHKFSLGMFESICGRTSYVPHDICDDMVIIITTGIWSGTGADSDTITDTDFCSGTGTGIYADIDTGADAVTGAGIGICSGLCVSTWLRLCIFWDTGREPLANRLF